MKWLVAGFRDQLQRAHAHLAIIEHAGDADVLSDVTRQPHSVRRVDEDYVIVDAVFRGTLQVI